MKKLSFALLMCISLSACNNSSNMDLDAQVMEQNTQISSTKLSKNQFVVKLAGRLHEIWQQSRKKMPDGTYEPRIKDTKDQAWSKAHGGKTQLDIANTTYENLPADWQAENKASAEVASNIIFKLISNQKTADAKFIEESSASIHVEWLKRNTWAKGNKEVDMPYAKLSEVEKEKDRVIIKEAIALAKKNGML
ncbi:MAG: hypothetical protein U0457_17695 [Candidatus Sericytochromatia bacterium]